jgi:hypothetical protein
MISLDSDEWLRLRHAYGAASDIPALIRQVRADPSPKVGYTDEPWFSLWSALCHQGDAYEASYAAVPHLVRIAIDASGPIDRGFFSLPACIEVARAKGRGPQVSPDLQADYSDALRRMPECIYQHASDDWDSDMAQAITAALAAAKGQHQLAEAIINLDSHIIDRLIAGIF